MEINNNDIEGIKNESEKRKRRRLVAIEKGICTSCFKEVAENNKKTCPVCLGKHKMYLQKRSQFMVDNLLTVMFGQPLEVYA